MKPASQRFESLWEAISDNRVESHILRQKLMEAYGFPRGGGPIDHQSAEAERDFAMNCLRGIGGREGQFQFESPNLISVLATEIGLLQNPQEDNSPTRPWFGGDWVSMAELVIYISEKATGLATGSFGRGPKDLIRVYPVKWLTAELTTANLLKARLKLGEGQFEEITLQVNSTSIGAATNSEWISLCVPLNKLYLISNQLPEGSNSGIPDNLWTALRPGSEPGAEYT